MLLDPIGQAALTPLLDLHHRTTSLGDRSGELLNHCVDLAFREIGFDDKNKLVILIFRWFPIRRRDGYIPSWLWQRRQK